MLYVMMVLRDRKKIYTYTDTRILLDFLYLGSMHIYKVDAQQQTIK